MAMLVSWLAEALYWLIMIRIIISFMPDVGRYPWAKWVVELTEPILAPLRRMIPPIRLGPSYVDFSPFIVLLVVDLLRTWVVRVLR